MAAASSATSVDLPLPGTPVMPTTCARPGVREHRVERRPGFRGAGLGPRQHPRDGAHFAGETRRRPGPRTATYAISCRAEALVHLAEHLAIVDHALRLEVGARERPRRHDFDPGPQAEHLQQRFRGLVAQRVHARLAAGVHRRRGLDADEQLVHRALAGDHDPVLAAVAGEPAHHRVDLARIHVLAADREHVVDAAEHALRQPRVGAAARIGAVLPQREVAGHQPDHRLRRPLEMGVDGRAALAVGHAVERLRVADLGVDDVLPAQHAVGLGACRRRS